ncbi:transmembrane and ubiquitin-like domain-containing protein 1 [Watersipora subatra]|uniref:transmembrane and ubiquitin-like domain-containing protein 1 n=1 Tax=Watersipora subatra TaxID=2589382 RepID=UPI00355B3764
MMDEEVQDETVYAMIEGIGNEVLVASVLGLTLAVLVLSWYSTNLTSTQTRLSTVRVNRRRVALNRFPGCSSRDRNLNQQEEAGSARQESPGRSPTPQADVGRPGADVVATEGVVDEVLVDTSMEDAPIMNQRVPLDNLPEVAGDDQSADVTSNASIDGTEPAAVSAEAESINGVNSVQEIIGSTGSNAETSETGDSQPITTSAEPASSHQEERTERTPIEETTNSDEPSQLNSAEDNRDISIRIKFLNDNERLVRAKTSDTVVEFKRNNFGAELSENKLVRLIFNGQVLQDNNTLESYGIVNNTAIHALISDIPSIQPETTPQPNVLVFNAGVLLVPLFVIILLFLWYLRFGHPELFNITSTLSLGSITGVFVYCLSAQRRLQPPQRNSQRQYGVNVGMNINAPPQHADRN